MSKASNNIKEDLKKNKPNKLAPIINTIISGIFIIVVIIIKCLSNDLSWGLFIGFLIVLILFPIASWFNSYFSKKQKTKMLYSLEKETELIVEFLQHRKNFKAFEENEKIKVSAETEICSTIPTYNYNQEKSSLGFPDSNYALMTIGIGFAGVEIDPSTKEIINIKGLLPRSIWLKKNLKTPVNVQKAKIKITTEGVEIRNKTLIQINKQADTYYNAKTGWICIGEVKQYPIDKVYEIVENSYIVLRDNKIISIWIYVGTNLSLY